MSDYGQLASDLRVEIQPGVDPKQFHMLTITNRQGVLVLIAHAVDGRFGGATEILTKLYQSHTYRPVSEDELRSIMGWRKKEATR